MATFPPPYTSANPYQRLLYASLAEFGFVLASPARLRSTWLWRSRNEVGCLHFHWLAPYYHHERRLLGAVRLVVFAQRLVLARLLGYRIVWTVHEIHPHVRLSRADVVAPHILARLADSLIVHDQPTRQRVVATLGRSPIVIPHGSFADVYPHGRARVEIRHALGIPETVVLVLVFGLVSRYKHLDQLMSALTLLPPDECDNLVVLVAGQAMEADVARALEATARSDRRLKVDFRYVPEDEVAELFDACDAALLTRMDDGTSGALVLALSLRVPVIVADTPGYRAATEASGVRHWYFTAGDPRSLAGALRFAEAELGDHSRSSTPTPRSDLEWSAVAARTASVLSGEPD